MSRINKVTIIERGGYGGFFVKFYGSASDNRTYYGSLQVRNPRSMEGLRRVIRDNNLCVDLDYCEGVTTITPARFTRVSDEYTAPARELPRIVRPEVVDAVRQWLTTAPQSFDALVDRCAVMNAGPWELTCALGALTQTHSVITVNDLIHIKPRNEAE